MSIEYPISASSFGILENSKVLVATVEASSNAFLLLVVEIKFNVCSNTFVDANG